MRPDQERERERRLPLPSKAPPPWMINEIDRGGREHDDQQPALEIPVLPPDEHEVVWPPPDKKEEKKDEEKPEAERGVVIIDLRKGRR